MSGFTFTHLAEVGSTNDWMLQHANDVPDYHWLVADRQTAGRGRRGRAWNDGAGNFMGSVLVKAEGRVEQLSFVAALALYDALILVTSPSDEDDEPPPAREVGDFRLKWPNDVLLDGRKCSGILLERQGTALVIGFGVNLVSHPETTERPAISLAAAGLRVPDTISFLGAISSCFREWRMSWEQDGFAPIRAAWLARASGVGGRIVARLGNESPEGVFTGLADDGALLMQLDDGSTRAIHAGEVFAL